MGEPRTWSYDRLDPFSGGLKIVKRSRRALRIHAYMRAIIRLLRLVSFDCFYVLLVCNIQTYNLKNTMKKHFKGRNDRFKTKNRSKIQKSHKNSIFLHDDIRT